MFNYGMLAGAFVSFIIGGALIEAGIEMQADDTSGLLAVAACGGIFWVLSAVLLYMRHNALKEEGRGNIWLEFKAVMFPDETAPPDKTPTEFLLTAFRRDYAQFFREKGNIENDAVQNEATQIAWNILELQKRRLDHLKVRLDFQAERRQYGDSYPVTSQRYFDGRYEVEEVREEIASVRKFSVDGRERYSKKDNQIAYYTLLSTKTRDDNHIICPSCGNATTRENLLDGCDYCGTKFTVEDLGTRVSDFVLRQDFNVQYEKYEQIRARMGAWVNLIVGGIVFLLSTIGMLSVSDEIEAGFFLKSAGVILPVIFLTWAACFLANYFFWSCIFPFIQLIASSALWSSRYIEERRREVEADNRAEQEAKRFDELFSLAGFYSNVQNKLAMIHYAASAAEINAVALCDISERLGQYGKIVNLEVDEMHLQGFQITEKLQRAEVTAKLDLLEKSGNGLGRRTERVRIELVKSVDCKTKSVSTPAVMRCEGCGASMLVLEGKRCTFCGHEIDLPEYDWTIVSYKTE